jgi:hypothetical protein
MPFCSECGTEIAAGAAACPRCGRPQYHVIAARPTDGQAIASLVLGIVGISGCPVVASIIAIVLGNQAKARIAANPELQGEGMAKAGVILGYVGIALVGVFVLFYALFAAFAFVVTGP